MRALERANDKVALVGIVIWALGKLGAKNELLKLEPLIDELDRAFPMEPDGRRAALR